MKKIWAKIIKNNRIVKDCALERKSADFYDNLKEVCYTLNIETPVVLNKHNNEIEEYNITRFKSGDFIDSINFDYLQIEYFEVS